MKFGGNGKSWHRFQYLIVIALRALRGDAGELG